MVRLGFPSAHESDSGMGHFRVSVQVGSRTGEHLEGLEALVDTGSTYTWIPRDVLEDLGVVPEEERPVTRLQDVVGDSLAGGRSVAGVNVEAVSG